MLAQEIKYSVKYHIFWALHCFDMLSFKFKIEVPNVVNPHVWVSAKRLNRIKLINLLIQKRCNIFTSLHICYRFIVSLILNVIVC